MNLKSNLSASKLWFSISCFVSWLTTLMIISNLVLTQQWSFATAKQYPKCHLIAIEQCFDKLHQLKDPKNDPSILLTTFDVVKEDFAGCIGDFIKKCGTPLHKELSKTISDAILDHLNAICDSDSKLRNGTLLRFQIVEKSSCIHKRILSNSTYQKECNNPLFTTIAWGEMKAHSKNRQISPIDYVLDAGCCGFRHWEQCTMDKVRKECDQRSAKILQTVISKLFGGIDDFICNAELFSEKSKICLAMPSLEEQSSRINLTYSDRQKLSLFSFVKMFLTRIK
ncbi:hypothetical protein QR98_0086240 [Sarcoptes scabiei]|uniref:Uncharacterized protein n=1 Tax=Sarcoptes scabiei TaxID=52283 RepID=A0A132AGE3_SARSC|nr:hypothetical protein QR98_0086240 [Sarcoptes scabiei]